MIWLKEPAVKLDFHLIPLSVSPGISPPGGHLIPRPIRPCWWEFAPDSCICEAVSPSCFHSSPSVFFEVLLDPLSKNLQAQVINASVPGSLQQHRVIPTPPWECGHLLACGILRVLTQIISKQVSSEVFIFYTLTEAAKSFFGGANSWYSLSVFGLVIFLLDFSCAPCGHCKARAPSYFCQCARGKLGCGA